MSYTITQSTPRPEPKRIDYERMAKEFPRQKAALTRALKTGDPVKVADTCIATVKAWDEIGAWPDDWSAWQRALDDVLPWNQHVELDDIAYGRVKIERA